MITPNFVLGKFFQVSRNGIGINEKDEILVIYTKKHVNDYPTEHEGFAVQVRKVGKIVM